MSEGDARRPRRAVPHIREFLADSLTPLGVYRRLAAISPLPLPLRERQPAASGSPASASWAPRRGRSTASTPTAWRSSARAQRTRCPASRSRRCTRSLQRDHSEPGPIPFTGGLVGYFGYDLIRLVERLPDRPPDPFDLPIALLARFDTLVVFDHARQRVLAIANEIEGEASVAAAESELGAPLAAAHRGDAAAAASPCPAIARARRHRPAEPRRRRASAAPCSRPRSTSPPATSSRSCWPAAGRCRGASSRSPSTARCAWSTRAPTWCSSRSPGRVAGRRLARDAGAQGGAAPRDPADRRHPAARRRTPRATSASPSDLLADPKERAEHVMLVDLGRNDLGRVAVPGSVRVPTLHGDRALQPRHAPGLQRRGRAGAGQGRARRAARLLPGRHRLGRAQDPGHGDHRRAGAAGAAAPTPAPSATSRISRRPRHLHRHPHPGRPRGARPRSPPAPASSPTPIPRRRSGRPRTRRRRCCSRGGAVAERTGRYRGRS